MMDSIHGLEERVDPIHGLEERIVRAIVVALKEGQEIAQSRVPPLPRETPPITPPLPIEMPSSTLNEANSSVSSILRGFAQRGVNVFEDLKKYLIKSSLGGQDCKPKEVMSFISIVEDFFT